MHKYLVRNPESRNAKRMKEIRTTEKHDLEGFYTNQCKRKLLYCYNIVKTCIERNESPTPHFCLMKRTINVPFRPSNI